ncbi:MAG TPA: hypothetical protein PL009_02470 [Flavipsychrobacter sp.]|nr:hypothetical protein [Flavipsychrobacter sp.]
MKLQRILPFLFTGALATGAIVGVSSCNKSDDDKPPVVTGAGELKGDISGNRVLTADSVYTIKGYVYVKDGGTLTIPAGTILKSDVIEKAAIIVERGGKIMAEGTAQKPIVFTSGAPKGQRRPGDWGGVIILGKAPTNRSTEPTIEGGVNRQYGGNDANDNSGVMKYVRIEFAGIAAAPGSEINGLTLGGVGAGTTIENIMVSYGNDDAYEFFGGTVNAKNLVAFANSDDDFDFDFGYVGKLQYGLAIKHPQYADIGDASNGIECDNDGTGTNATPFTHPKISNFTFVGPNNRANTQSNHNFANRWRRSTHFTLRNSVMIGWQKGGFSVESSETGSSYTNGTSEFKNNLVHAITRPFYGNSGSGLTDSAVLSIAVASGSSKLDSANAAQLTNPWSLTAPNFTPLGSSPAATGASFAGMDAWFTQVTFRGAIGSADWTQGWTNWDPNYTDY